MVGVRVLVIAGPREAEGVRRAVAAAGGLPAAADGTAAGGDLGQVVRATRPDAILLASGPAVGEPVAVARRVRVAAGARIPVVFVGEAAELPAVAPLVDAVFSRPVVADVPVARAIALTLPGPSAAARAAAQASEPANVAAIADGIEATLATALEGAARNAARAGGARGDAGGAGGGSSAGPPGVSLAPLWLEIADPDEPAPWADARPPAAAPAEASEGDLADVDLPMLLGRLHARASTGRLVINQERVEKVVFLEAGRPVCARSDEPRDRMVEMLLRDGDLTAEQRQVAVAAAAESPRRMGALLVELGLVGAGGLRALVRRHHEEVLASLLSWTDGRWRFEPDRLPPRGESRLLGHPAALVRRGLAARYAPERLWTRLGGPDNVFLLDPGARGAELLDEVAAGEGERRACLLFDGVRSLRAVARATGLGETEVAGLAFTLMAFGALVPASASPAGAAARATSPALPGGDPRLRRARIAARHALALQGDYFQFLGVDRDASPSEIRHAHARARAAIDPAEVGPALAGELAGELGTIAEVLDEALRVLTSDTLRARYAAHLRPEPRPAARPPEPYPVLVAEG